MRYNFSHYCYSLPIPVIAFPKGVMPIPKNVINSSQKCYVLSHFRYKAFPNMLCSIPKSVTTVSQICYRVYHKWLKIKRLKASNN